jgi:serine protease Do
LTGPFHEGEEKMRNTQKKSMLTLGAVAAASIVAGMLIASKFDLTGTIGADPVPADKAGTAEVSAAGPGSRLFVDIAKRDTPAVVNISTTQFIKQQRPFSRRRQPSPFDDFFGRDDFWERFFGEVPERDLKQQSLGSGFIVDKEGFILTNNHVVGKADDIKVTLSDGRSYEAELKGTDPKTDIALIKIDAENDLPVAELGDSDALEVGEWVVAIGNPFGLKHTVTVGVVSAKGRTIGAGPYDDFIQTDASINPGNSGGPLINTKGEVIGINTAIIGQGIGFAIPVNLARNIMDQLKEKGSVTRGWLGVQIQTVTPELAESLGLDEARGALIAGVFKDDPADKAGIEVGDVVIEFDGAPVETDRDLVSRVGNAVVGSTVTVKVVRDGQEKSFDVELARRSDDEDAAAVEDSDPIQPFKLGITVQDLTKELAERMRVEADGGVLVTEVESGSVADKAGIQRGDIIVEVNKEEVEKIDDFRAVLKKSKKDEKLLFLVKRGQGNRFIVVTPEKEAD